MMFPANLIHHPCTVGDLPEFVQLTACAHLLPIDQRSLQSNWKTRYPDFLERRKVGGLWINVQACDQWLDERGKKLLSSGLLEEKRRRNPGWIPAGERAEAWLAAQSEILEKLADLVARKLHTNSTFKGVGGGA